MDTHAGPGEGLAQGVSPSRPPWPAPAAVSSSSFRSGIVTTDITDMFKSSCALLDKGMLVKDEYFTLFDSVSALEIMDPDTDSGYLKEGEILEETYDSAQELSAEEVVAVMDQLLGLEMAWHLGHPLSQTLFTSVHVEALLEPSNVVNGYRFQQLGPASSPFLRALRAYCIGVVKSAGRVIDLVKSELYNEEEDFVTDTYRRPLLETATSHEIIDNVEMVRAVLAPLKETDEAGVMHAIDARLRLRIIFLRALESLAAEDEGETMRTCWEDGIDVLVHINESHRFAKPVPDAFSKKLQRKLASNMPMRPIVQLTFEDAHGHALRMFENMRDAVGVLDYVDSQTVIRFVNLFHSRKPQPLALTRAMMQNLIFSNMRVLRFLSMRHVIDDDLAVTSMPTSAFLDPINDEYDDPLDPRTVVALRMEQFRKRAARRWLDMLATLCQNRCRTRRMLCHAVHDWETLRIEGERVDGELARAMPPSQTSPSPPMLGPWATTYKLRHVEWIVLMGFELELYQPAELAGMYAFLSKVARARASYAKHVRTRAFANGVAPTPHTVAEISRSLGYTRLTLLETGITTDMSDALALLYSALHRLDLITTPASPARSSINTSASDEMRYELRMRPFTSHSHTGNGDNNNNNNDDGHQVVVPPYAEFEAAWRRPDMSVHELLADAAGCVSRAKGTLAKLQALPAEDTYSSTCRSQWEDTVKNWQRSAIAAGLAASVVQAAVDKARDGARGEGELLCKVEVPGPGKAYTGWWIVPRIVPLVVDG